MMTACSLSFAITRACDACHCVSSCVVYEDSAIDWSRSDYDPYARTKKFAEHMLHELLPPEMVRTGSAIARCQSGRTFGWRFMDFASLRKGGRE